VVPFYKQGAVTLIPQLFTLSVENENLHNTFEVCWGKLDFTSQGCKIITLSHQEGSTIKSLFFLISKTGTGIS